MESELSDDIITAVEDGYLCLVEISFIIQEELKKNVSEMRESIQTAEEMLLDEEYEFLDSRYNGYFISGEGTIDRRRDPVGLGEGGPINPSPVLSSGSANHPDDS